MGGRAAHQKGTAHEFSSEEAREAGRKGGRAVSQNREHMSAIGREGGESRAANHTRQTPAGPEEQSASRSDEEADEMTD
jgi:general stress protein YciG